MTDLHTRPGTGSDSETDSGTDLATARRRFTRRRWARRWLAWRRLVVLAVVVALVAGSVWLVYASSVLAVRGTTVLGTSTLDPSAVSRAAGVPTGTPLARVDLDAVRARVEALPAVAEADVSRQWPHQVRVVVTERVPVALTERDGSYAEIDADGVVFRQVARRERGLPLVRVADKADAQALAEVAQVVVALPDDVLRLVTSVEVASIDRITLNLRRDRTVTWGSADDSADKAAVLGVLLQRRASEYDVTVPGQPTTR